MTTDFHDAIAIGAPANASTFNAPLAQLDEALGDNTAPPNFSATGAPTVNDDVDLGYEPGSIWVDLTNDLAYVCLDATDGAAVWTEITVTNVRERLTANRTYYVATTGSDSNDGLTALTPFLTIQHAWDTLSTLDTGGYDITIQLANGTYTAGLDINSPWTGGGSVTINGDTVTPSNVIISTTSNDCIKWTNTLPGPLSITGIKFQTTTSGNGIAGYAPGRCSLQSCDFGTIVNTQIYAAAPGATIITSGNYTISGGSSTHMTGVHGGFVQSNFITVTVSGTPAFSTAFAQATAGGEIESASNTYSGSATGPRYSVTLNAVINTFGGGASYFPGDSAGSTATGGQYA